MKRIFSVLIAVSIILGNFLFSGYAENESALTVYNPETDNIALNVDYPEKGKPIRASVKGREGESFLYKWFIDNIQINNFSDSYTPVAADNERMLTVKVYDTGCNLVGEKNTFISSLPVIYIETDNRQPIVSKTVQLDAHMRIQGNSEFCDSSVLYDGKTQIKGRGNSTWGAAKKPYKLKLDSKADLFGMGKSKHWVLLSNPFDSSNMRNDVSYKLSEYMGLNTQKCVWVELVLNGSHVGLYQLVEHVRIEENRVNITKWDDVAENAAKAVYKKNTDSMTKDERDELIGIMTADMNWVTTDSVTFKKKTYRISDYYEVPPITGGYLLEASVESSPNSFYTPSGIKVAIDEPEGIGAGMKDYISGYYCAFDRALMSDDYCTEYMGKTMRYSDFIDVESFAKGILINEIFENSDFGTKSTWMSKDIDGKLVFGPVWDMDYTIISSFGTWTTAKKTWIKRILSDPVFMEVVRDTYFKYRYTAVKEILKEGGYFDSALEKIADSASLNDKIWNNDLQFRNNAEDFRTRLQTKINWLDDQFESLDSALSSVADSDNYSNYINSSDIALNMTGDTLNIKFDKAPSKVKVFVNGNPIKTIDRPLISNDVKTGDISDSIITVFSYDADGKVIAGKSLSLKKYVTSLTVSPISSEKSYNIGERIRVDDFIITASYSDGSSKNISPDLIYTYAKDSLGTQRFCYGKVTDKAGEIYAVLMSAGKRAEIKLNIIASEDYLTVEKCISEIPDNKADKEYFRMLFEAQTRFEKLNDSAKAKVENFSKLESAMNNLNNATAASDVSVIACYGDGAMRYDTKNNVVVLVKGKPRSVIFRYQNAGTSTYGRDNKNVLCIKRTSGYELWTINHTFNSKFEYYDMHAAYQGNPQVSDVRIYTKDLIVNKTEKYEEYSYQPLKKGSLFFVQCPDKPVSDGVSVKIITDETVNGVNLISTANTMKMNAITVKNGYKIWNGTINAEYEYSVYVNSKITSEKVKFTPIRADVNFDMIINSADALVVLQSSVGSVRLNDVQRRCADVNSDGVINSADALIILQYSVGLINKI